jgi:hypothetical protein
VRVDGEPRYRSPEVRYGDRPLPLEVDLRGARRLLLSVASATGEASPRAMAIWERARLVAAE